MFKHLFNSGVEKFKKDNKKARYGQIFLSRVFRTNKRTILLSLFRRSLVRKLEENK